MRAAACLAGTAVLCLATGFVHGPQPQWTRGKLAAIDTAQKEVVVREPSAAKAVVLVWDKETRMWLEPTRRSDRGAPFDPQRLAPGNAVRIMFKKYSDHNLMTRIIRLAPASGSPEGTK